jgi:hypothetical protein
VLGVRVVPAVPAVPAMSAMPVAVWVVVVVRVDNILFSRSVVSKSSHGDMVHRMV